MAARKRSRRRARSVPASFRKPTRRAKENWEALDHQQQLRAVAWASEFLHRNAKRYFQKLGGNILAVGSGYRVRGKGRGKKRKIVEEPVVTVVVSKKWTHKQILARIRKYGRGVIAPRHIQLTVPIAPTVPAKRTRKAYHAAYGKKEPPKRRKRKTAKTRRLVLRLPVDVREPYTAVAAQGAQSARPPQQVTVTSSQGNVGAGTSIAGTACALVQQSNSRAATPQRYLLGCNHVVYRTLIRPPSQKDTRARVFVNAAPAPSPVEIGSAAGNAPFSTSDWSSIDAAVVKLNADGAGLTSKSSFWRPGSRPNDWVRDRTQLLDLITIPGVAIFLYPGAKASAAAPVKKLQHVTRHLSFPVKYQSGSTVRIAEVIEFKVLNGKTVGGNSGSPVVCLGHFVGMHIAGNEDLGLSFVIPAWLLMRADQVLPGGLAFA